MATIAKSLNFPTGGGMAIPATARGIYSLTLWSSGTDLVARVRKNGAGDGTILNISYKEGTTASLEWEAGALIVESSTVVQRYGTVVHV